MRMSTVCFLGTCNTVARRKRRPSRVNRSADGWLPNFITCAIEMSSDGICTDRAPNPRSQMATYGPRSSIGYT